MRNGIWFLILCFFSFSRLFAAEQPDLSLSKDFLTIMDFEGTPPAREVIVGESYRQRFNIHVNTSFINNFCGFQWQLPYGVSMVAVDNACPWMVVPGSVYRLVDTARFSYPFPFFSHCVYEAVFQTSGIGQVLSGHIGLVILVGDKKHDTLPCGGHYPALESHLYFIKAIPHPLSLAAIPTQSAIANQDFLLDIKPYVFYFDENAGGGFPAKALVIPESQAGLSFDPVNFIIRGRPTQPGHYQFLVSVGNQYSQSAQIPVDVDVGINPLDTPVFKSNASFLATALPGENYHMNLLDLLEHQASFMSSNQLQFRIDSDLSSPSWLHIDDSNPTSLQGKVPRGAAGQSYQLTLIATSNTGGDSLPLTLSLPVAYDAEKQPALKYVEMKGIAKENFEFDMKPYVIDPSHDDAVTLLLDKAVPLAPWLHVSQTDSMKLVGQVPAAVEGQTWQLSLRVNTHEGGSSTPVTLPLHIEINKQLTPHFNEIHPQLPVLQKGQSYLYDFVSNKTIYPDFSDVPYRIDFAKDCNNPYWLRLENNQLIADLVPDTLSPLQKICLQLSNTPGGSSKPIPIDLTVL